MANPIRAGKRSRLAVAVQAVHSPFLRTSMTYIYLGSTSRV